MTQANTNRQTIDKTCTLIPYDVQAKIDDRIRYFGNTPSTDAAFDATHNKKKNSLLRAGTGIITVLAALSIVLAVNTPSTFFVFLAIIISIAAMAAQMESSQRKERRAFWEAMAGDDDDKAIKAYYYEWGKLTVKVDIAHEMQSVVANIKCSSPTRTVDTRAIKLDTGDIEATLEDINYLVTRAKQAEAQIQQYAKGGQLQRMKEQREKIQSMQKVQEETLPESKDIAKTLDDYAKDLQKQVHHIGIEQKTSVEIAATATSTNS